MGVPVFVALLLAGFGGEAPDGRLVLGVAGGEPDSNVVTREWAAVADPRSGGVRKRRLQGGALCGGPVLAIGDRVIFRGSRGRHAVALSLPLSLRGSARSLGPADTATPLLSHASVWLARWLGRSRLGLRQVDARGREQVRAAVPGWRWSSVYAALGTGFVVSERNSLVVFGPGHGVRAFSVHGGWFLGASDTRVAWCSGSCGSAHLWSRHGRRDLTLPARARPLGTAGAFSPDGRTLALAVTVRAQARVALVDARSGTSTLVPGGKLGGYDAIAWSRSGRWLYFTESNRSLRAWRVGADTAARLPIDAGGTVMSIDIAP